MVLQSLLDRFGDRAGIEAVELPCPNQLPGLAAWQGETLDPELRKAVRILPDRIQDAFFLCRIRKQ